MLPRNSFVHISDISDGYIKRVYKVVFFPLLFLLLISPDCETSSLKIELINDDFPTPEFPAKEIILGI